MYLLLFYYLNKDCNLTINENDKGVTNGLET